jgi:hypothetical protein
MIPTKRQDCFSFGFLCVGDFPTAMGWPGHLREWKGFSSNCTELTGINWDALAPTGVQWSPNTELWRNAITFDIAWTFSRRSSSTSLGICIIFLDFCFLKHAWNLWYFLLVPVGIHAVIFYYSKNSWYKIYLLNKILIYNIVLLADL